AFHDEGGNAVEVTVIDLLDEGLLLEVRTVGAIQGDDDDEQTPWQVDPDGRDQWDDSYHETDAARNSGNSADISNHAAQYERYFAHEDSDFVDDAEAALTLEIGQVLAAARIINDLETPDMVPPVAAVNADAQRRGGARNPLASELERESASWRGHSTSSFGGSTGEQYSDNNEVQSDAWDISPCPLTVETTFVVYRGDGETTTDEIQAQQAGFEDWLMMLPVLDADGELCDGSGGAWDAWEHGVGFAIASSPSSAREGWDELIWRGFDADGNPSPTRTAMESPGGR
ncbi:hypothetical protein HK405_003473, partial [Cladochytrium tenue]